MINRIKIFPQCMMQYIAAILFVITCCLTINGCTSYYGNNRVNTEGFRQQMNDAINKEKRYPYGASDAGIQGNVLVEFDYTTGDKASNVHILRSSGNTYLDNAALEAVKYATLPAKPPKYQTATHFIILVDFEYSHQ